MNMRQKIEMTLLALAPLALFGARVTPLPTLPCGELPNSEVSTNIALNVDYARLENLTFSLELNASASNSLSIAVGTAAGDTFSLELNASASNSLSIAVGTAAGDSLALDDADFEWGYDCGKWFRSDTATGDVDEWPEPGTGRVSRTLTIERSDFNPQWNRLRIIKRGVGDVEVGLSYSREYTKFTIRIR